MTRTAQFLARLGWKRSVLPALVLLLGAYLVSYLFRRAGGGYRYVASGELRLSGAFAVFDLAQWSPADCWWQPGFMDVSGKLESRGNTAGYFFSPLIWVDRRWFFPDIPLFDVAGNWRGKSGDE